MEIQLPTQINLISSEGSEKTCTIHAKSHSVEIMMCSKTDKIIE